MAKTSSGERVTLRRLREVDIDERFTSWFQDKELMQFYRGNPRPMSRQDLLEEFLDFKSKGEIFVYAIVLIENDLVIGTIKIGPVHTLHGTSDLVVLIGDVAYHGKGLAVEAIIQGNNLAFTKHKVRKLHGGMYASNAASIGAYLKAGWVIEGSLKDHYLVDGKPMDRVLVACFPDKD
jgi:ribosomal-protein-alanine N-acetyltransferase